MIGFGLGVLRLAPADFWAMTPRELAAVIGHLAPVRHPAPLRRDEFSALLNRYPDRERTTDGR